MSRRPLGAIIHYAGSRFVLVYIWGNPVAELHKATDPYGSLMFFPLPALLTTGLECVLQHPQLRQPLHNGRQWSKHSVEWVSRTKCITICMSRWWKWRTCRLRWGREKKKRAAQHNDNLINRGKDVNEPVSPSLRAESGRFSPAVSLRAPNLYLSDILINPSSFLTTVWQAAKLGDSSLMLVSPCLPSMMFIQSVLSCLLASVCLPVCLANPLLRAFFPPSHFSFMRSVLVLPPMESSLRPWRLVSASQKQLHGSIAAC